MTPEEFASALDARPFSAVREELMTKVLFIVLRHSQKRTPVKSGTLRRSETTRLEEQGARGFLGTNVVYAPFVHNRVPFFEQGIEDSRGEIASLLTKIGEGYMGSLAS